MNRHLDGIRRHPSAVLLIGQLVAVLVYPFLDDNAVGRAILGVFGMGLVLIAIWAVRLTPVLRWVAVLLGGPAMVLTVLEALWPTTDWIVLTSALWHAPFYFYVSYAMIQYLFHDDKVTRDELYATGAAFTVVAWGFAYVFSGVQVIWPNSFTGSSDVGWYELLFLSFSNLTSVGLSDVLPVLEHARSVVMVEMVVGVLYVALVVARMVGLTVVRASSNDARDSKTAGMASTDPWEAFEHDPRRAENAGLRASDLDRDVVHHVLGEAYAEGRLDRDEFDQRSESVAATRTLGELPEIMSDLVPSRALVPAVERHEAAVAEYRAERRNALWGFLSASTVCWVIWFATGMSFPWPLFVMLGTGLNLGRIAFERESRIAELERRIEKRERKELAKEQRKELGQPDA